MVGGSLRAARDAGKLFMPRGEAAILFHFLLKNMNFGSMVCGLP
jgi:hypothetical protein